MTYRNNNQKYINDKELKKVSGGDSQSVHHYVEDCPKCKKHSVACVDVVTPLRTSITKNCTNCDFTYHRTINNKGEIIE